MSLTTTVTFADLADAYDGELSDLTDAHEDLVAHAEAEYGDAPEWPREVVGLSQAIDESVKRIQQRQHLLGDVLADEYPDGDFTLRMLTGSDMEAIEADLRMEADTRDADLGGGELETYRKQVTVAASIESAPGDLPTGDDADREAVRDAYPNALLLALHEQVERFNGAGDVDFRARGVGSDPLAAAGIPARQTPSGETSSDTPAPSTPDATPTDPDPADSGNSSSTN